MRACVHGICAWIFEQNFVDDKANFRRRAVARQENSTQSAAKFAEKTCAISYEYKLLDVYGRKGGVI